MQERIFYRETVERKRKMMATSFLSVLFNKYFVKAPSPIKLDTQLSTKTAREPTKRESGERCKRFNPTVSEPLLCRDCQQPKTAHLSKLKLFQAQHQRRMLRYVDLQFIRVACGKCL